MMACGESRQTVRLILWNTHSMANRRSPARVGGTPRAASTPAPEAPQPFTMQLQEQAGNQAVQELLRSGVIQAKLAISSPDDPEERETDHVAHTIMRSRAESASAAPCSCAEGVEMCEECRQKQSKPTIHRRASAPTLPPHVPRIVSDDQPQLTGVPAISSVLGRRGSADGVPFRVPIATGFWGRCSTRRA
jgi:hypothetical protein